MEGGRDLGICKKKGDLEKVYIKLYVYYCSYNSRTCYI